VLEYHNLAIKLEHLQNRRPPFYSNIQRMKRAVCSFPRSFAFCGVRDKGSFSLSLSSMNSQSPLLECIFPRWPAAKQRTCKLLMGQNKWQFIRWVCGRGGEMFAHCQIHSLFMRRVHNWGACSERVQAAAWIELLSLSLSPMLPHHRNRSWGI